MRIVVNDIAASTGGALTVLKDFYNCVRETDTENEWVFLLGDHLLEETENIKVITLPEIKKNHCKKLLFDFFSGRKYIGTLNPDAVLSLQNTAVWGLKVPQLIYIHQSIPFQRVKRFSFLKKNEQKLAMYQYLIGTVIKLSARVCDKVIVQTEWMKQAVCEQCRLPEDRVLKVSPTVPDLSIQTKGQFCNHLFFYPTAPAIYKNNSAIFAASDILKKKQLNHTVILTLPHEFSRESIRCVGRLPYHEVIQTYTQSTLVFPSYIETFGFPMAEARKVGTIVLASDCPFSREVLQDYENAYFFDPFKPEELADLMERVITGDIQKRSVAIIENPQANGWNLIRKEVIRSVNKQ